MPKAESSYSALDEVYEALEIGREGGRSAADGNLGDFGDFGDLGDFALGEGGALAMRITGEAAASSGCRNGLCGRSSAALDAPLLRPGP